MKTIDKLIICKGFALCRGIMSPYDSYYYTLEETSTDTKFSQLLYLLYGGGIAPDGKEYHNNLLLDVRDYYQKPFAFKSGSAGAMWLCINPIPANKFFDASLIKAGETRTIVGDGKEHVILSAKGDIIANDKTLEMFQYTRVLNGKEAVITVPENSEAIYLTR